MIVKSLIPILVFAPTIGAILQVLNPRPLFCRTVAILATVISAVTAGILFSEIDPQNPIETPQFIVNWIKSYSIHFALEVDGLNLLPTLATALIFPFLIISEWNRSFARRGIHALLLILETAILGALCSVDLFLLIFFLMMIPVPLYFLSSIWGDEGREKASFRMISVSLVASASLFLGVLIIFHGLEPHTFLIGDLRGKLVGKTAEIFGVSFEMNQIAFGLITFALALRAPIWPVHGWCRSLILRAPASIGVATLLAGYPVAVTVFTRIGYELFPQSVGSHLDLLMGAGIITAIFGTLSLLQEKDLRGILVSFSSIATGFSIIGVGTGLQTGLVGSQFILFSTAVGLAIWGFSSEILHYRSKTYLTEELSGVMKTLPDLGVSTLIALACFVGVPGTIGFISYSLLSMGSFNYHPGIIIVSLVVATVVSGFLIQVFRQIFLGEQKTASLSALTFRERVVLFPLVFVIVTTGFIPSPLVEGVKMTVMRILAQGSPN